MIAHHTVARVAALAMLSLSALACADRSAGPAGAERPEERFGSVVLQTSVAPPSIRSMSVEVTAPDIAVPILVTLTNNHGVFGGTVRVPAGGNRRFTVRAYDAAGVQSHEGSTTIVVRPSGNPKVTIALTSQAGDQPITVSLGAYAVSLGVTAVTLFPGRTFQLVVDVRDADGSTVSTPTLQWGSLNPSVADVDASGLITARVAGSTRVTVSYEGFAASADITVGTLGALPLGPASGGEGEAYDINEQGTVVGRWKVHGLSHPFVWTPAGGMVDLGLPPGPMDGEARAINDAGEVVGTTVSNVSDTFVFEAFRWTQAGGYTSFGAAGGGSSRAASLTSSGDVLVTTGAAVYLWSPSTVVALPSLSTSSSRLLEGFINDAGDGAGTFLSGGSNKPYRWSGGNTPTELPLPAGAGQGFVTGINAHGDVAGYVTISGTAHAVVWRSGATAAQPLGTLGGTRGYAHAIGDNGFVAGCANDDQNRMRPFVWTPVSGMVALDSQWGCAYGLNAAGQIVGYVGADGRATGQPMLWTLPAGYK